TPHRLLATSHTFPSFFFNASSTTDIYPLSLHDALPIYDVGIGDVRPSLGALLLGGRDRRVLARVADLHRGGDRHPSRHALRGAHPHRPVFAGGSSRRDGRALRAADGLRRLARRLRLAGQRAELAVILARPRPQSPLALSRLGGGWDSHGDLQRRRCPRRLARAGLMLFGAVAVTFLVLTIVSLPIVFSLGIAGFVGLVVGNFPL